MAAKRPTQSSADVTPTETGQTDGTAATASDPALAAPDSSSPAAQPTDAVAAPEVAAPVAAEPAASAAPVAPGQQVVYVEAPKPFVKKGNRGFGVLIALLSTVIFAVLYAVALVVVEFVNHAPVDFTFVTTLDFYAPVIMFAVGFILLVLIVNRAGWAAHVLGSIFVGLVVWFGGTGLILLVHINQIPSNEVGQTFSGVLISTGSIIAALLGREVALWMGFSIAAHGRKVKARNVDAKVLYDQEIAAKRAEYEQANAAAGVPVAATPAEPAAPAEAAEPVAEEPVAP